MGRGELEERADHQCRVGRVQLISDSATRWRTHRRWRASERLRHPACPARALRDANPHRSPLHFANAGCAIGSRSQYRLTSDRKLNGRHHWRHTAIDGQHMTTRRREQPLNTEPPLASRIAAKVADEIQSATLEWLSPRLFYTFNFFTLRGFDHRDQKACHLGRTGR